ncbi:hypothetical protein TNCV_4507111 [Trichonephila clavipes]|nr:hypothetical protein TNCV_4507111 [Trichonephila clavipes]
MLQKHFLGEVPVFQEDNVPVHKSRCVQMDMVMKCSYYCVLYLYVEAQSPPVDVMWKFAKRDVSLCVALETLPWLKIMRPRAISPRVAL